MTSYRNKYLEMLKTDFGKKPLPQEPSKLTKINFCQFCQLRRIGPFQIFHPLTMPRASPAVSARAVSQGEFWRWPKFHKDHDPRGWVCWFCSPPPEGSGPCDFCGVPEDNK